MSRRAQFDGHGLTLDDVRAVRPQRGQTVHLWAPGYRVGRRDIGEHQALCGVGVWATGRPVGEALEERLTELPDALLWSTFESSTRDPRPQWAWCRHCLGHFVVLGGLERFVLGGGAP